MAEVGTQRRSGRHGLGNSRSWGGTPRIEEGSSLEVSKENDPWGRKSEPMEWWHEGTVMELKAARRHMHRHGWGVVGVSRHGDTSTALHSMRSGMVDKGDNIRQRLEGGGAKFKDRITDRDSMMERPIGPW